MSTRERAIRGFGWFFLSSVSNKVLRLFNRLLVARLLVPEAFGLAVLAITIVGVFETVRTIGFDDALIALQDEREVASNTAFWVLTGFGVTLTALVVAVAPFVGSVFGRPRLVPLLQVLSVWLTLKSLETVPAALLQKDLEFKKKLLPGVLPPFVYLLVSVGLASKGYGIWSLIVGQVASGAVSVSANWVVARFLPSPTFSRAKARELFDFGSHIAVASVAGKLYQRLDDLVIGWLLGPTVLAAYSIGYMLGNLPAQAVSKPAAPVLYPALMRLQAEDRGSAWRNTVRMLGMVSIPMGAGLIVVIPTFVTVVLGPKYASAVPLVQIIAVYGVVRSISTVSGPVLKSSGRVRVLSRLMIVHAVVFAVIVGPLTIVFGATGTATAILVSSMPNNLGQIYYAIQELDVTLTDVLAPLVPYVAYASVMAVGVLGARTLVAGDTIVDLGFLVSVGAVIYMVQLLVLDYQFLKACSTTVARALVR